MLSNLGALLVSEAVQGAAMFALHQVGCQPCTPQQLCDQICALLSVQPAPQPHRAFAQMPLARPAHGTRIPLEFPPCSAERLLSSHRSPRQMFYFGNGYDNALRAANGGGVNAVLNAMRAHPKHPQAR